MKSTWLVSLVLATSLVAVAPIGPAAAQEVILQNDGFVDGQSVGFQGGFDVGEMAASRLLPTGTSPWTVNRVLFLFGGDTSTQTITLHIWDDAANTSNPGTELFVGDYSVTGSSVALQEIDLSLDDVQVSGQFRVGIEFQHAGFPSAARDGDGTIHPTKNFIYSPSSGGWFQSNLFGLTGDWVIRAGVTSTTTGVPAGRPLALALSAAGPNPSRAGRLLVSVQLPSDAPARLDLVDVTGRRVASQEVSALGAGRHTVDLSAGSRLASGIYVARLSQAGDARTVRMVVTQ
jgi:hypothetical protein